MEKIEFNLSDSSYNNQLKTGITADGKIVIIADPYYAAPIHEGLCAALDHYHDYEIEDFSTEFKNDADTSAECILSALRDLE